MGCYDFISGVCPQCGTEFTAQTKLFGDNFQTHTRGSLIGLEDMRLELKTTCSDCKTAPVAVIEKGVIVAFEIGNPTAKEGLFGCLLDPSDNPSPLP